MKKPQNRRTVPGVARVYAYEWDQEKLEHLEDDFREIRDTAVMFKDHIMQGSDGGNTTETAAYFGAAGGAARAAPAGPLAAVGGAVVGAAAGATMERAQACVNCHINNN